MFSSRSRSFNLSDSGRIERIQNRSVEIEKDLCYPEKLVETASPLAYHKIVNYG